MAVANPRSSGSKHSDRSWSALTYHGYGGEYVTPTGAAIVAAFKTSDTLPENSRSVRSGLVQAREIPRGQDSQSYDY